MHPVEETSDLSYGSRRGPIYLIFVCLGFGIILLRLTYLQWIRGDEFGELSTSNVVQFRRVPHERGLIVDRNGVVLANSRVSMGVYITPAFLPNAKRILFRMTDSLGLTRNEAELVYEKLTEEVQAGLRLIKIPGAYDQSTVAQLRMIQTELELPLETTLVRSTQENPTPYSNTNSNVYSVWIDPKLFPTQTIVLHKLKSITDLAEDEFEVLSERVRSKSGLERYLEIPVMRDISQTVQGQIELAIQLGELPGVSIKRSKVRQYPRGESAAHLLGYVNEVSPKDMAEHDYRLGDVIGRAGVERSYEDELRGTDGRIAMLVDSKGRQRAILSEDMSGLGDLLDGLKPFEEEISGHKINLSIDIQLQEFAEQAFHGTAGAVVAMSVNTGEIYALTSTPAYDPNLLTGRLDPQLKAALDQNPLRPWWSRAIQERAVPGSTFKVFTAIAALMEKKTTPSEGVFCPGAFRLGDHTFRCWKPEGHGVVRLHTALAQSCDVYFYTMGRRLGLDPIAHVAEGLGLGGFTGIDLPGESAGIIPTENWYKKNFGFYSLGAAVNASIGQGAVTVTPIQLAVAYASLANGGKVLTPSVVKNIESSDGKTFLPTRTSVKPPFSLPVEIRKEVMDGITAVVMSSYGTAPRARIPEVSIAGKTGTAQVAKLAKDRELSKTQPWILQDHAWFAALAPAENPEVVVVVFVEHGGSGSRAASPIASQVIRTWWLLKQGKRSDYGAFPRQF